MIVAVAMNSIKREDDKPETVKNRLAINIKNSEPILAYYKERRFIAALLMVIVKSMLSLQMYKKIIE